MNQTYIDTVRLLLAIAPAVFASGRFAMKGGKADIGIRSLATLCAAGLRACCAAEGAGGECPLYGGPVS
jgi:hypothetical protein